MGTKRYNTMQNIGKAKYVVNFHDGVETHGDGSDFFGIRIFNNKIKFNSFITELVGKGFVYSKPDMYL